MRLSRLCAEVPTLGKCQGRRLLLVDGARVTLPNTEDNQAFSLQPSSQKEGTRVSPGADVRPDCCVRSAIRCKRATSWDAYDATLFLLRELITRGVDGVFQQGGARRRSTNFTKGEALGVRDHLIELANRAEMPDWVSQYEYDRAPATLKVREFQAGGKILVTTFLGPNQTPRRVLKALPWRTDSVMGVMPL
jgi:hypothetical protein